MWRFSLQDPRTDERRGFATLEALLVSLQADLADESRSGTVGSGMLATDERNEREEGAGVSTDKREKG